VRGFLVPLYSAFQAELTFSGEDLPRREGHDLAVVRVNPGLYLIVIRGVKDGELVGTAG
jgi:hypothetical protein